MTEPSPDTPPCPRCGSPLGTCLCDCRNELSPWVQKQLPYFTSEAESPPRLRLSTQVSLKSLMIFTTLVAVGLALAQHSLSLSLYLTLTIPPTYLRTVAWLGGQRKQGLDVRFTALFSTCLESFTLFIVAYVSGAVMAGCMAIVSVIVLRREDFQVQLSVAVLGAAITVLLVVYYSWPRYYVD